MPSKRKVQTEKCAGISSPFCVSAKTCTFVLQAHTMFRLMHVSVARIKHESCCSTWNVLYVCAKHALHVFVLVRRIACTHAKKINVPAQKPLNFSNSSQTTYSYVVCLSRVSKLTRKKALSKLHIMPLAISQVLDRVIFLTNPVLCVFVLAHVTTHLVAFSCH